MYCNNKATVTICSTAETWSGIRAQLTPDIDLITEIKQLKALISVMTSWVKAHLDDHTEDWMLMAEKKLSIQVDKVAGAFLTANWHDQVSDPVC
eukprot:14015396-Ditylum_brightwellii.AAC.1